MDIQKLFICQKVIIFDQTLSSLLLNITVHCHVLLI